MLTTKKKLHRLLKNVSPCNFLQTDGRANLPFMQPINIFSRISAILLPRSNTDINPTWNKVCCLLTTNFVLMLLPSGGKPYWDPGKFLSELVLIRLFMAMLARIFPEENKVQPNQNCWPDCMTTCHQSVQGDACKNPSSSRAYGYQNHNLTRSG